MQNKVIFSELSNIDMINFFERKLSNIGHFFSKLTMCLLNWCLLIGPRIVVFDWQNNEEKTKFWDYLVNLTVLVAFKVG